jgi:SAM-dependent methyltransferase
MNSLLRQCINIEARAHEIFNGLDFSDDQEGDGRGYSNLHQSISAHYFKDLIGVAVNYSGGKEIFVDLGCGKGRALYLASRYQNFSQIIGVEMESKLLAKAGENLKKAKIKKCRLENVEASKYILPEMKSMVYFFNPFGPKVLGDFLMNNRKNFEKYGSLIAYANDVYMKILISEGFFPIYRKNRGSVWVRSNFRQDF